MRLTFLGTGTSTGVPFIGCHCGVCTSADPRDHRLRASAIVTTDAGRNLLIDCGPDFRQQILALDSPPLDALLVTHIHYDHVGGIEDLRPYCYSAPGGKGFPIYCDAPTAADIRQRLPYCFVEHPYPGAPTFDISLIDAGAPFTAGGVTIEPLRVMHGPDMPILGYRIGRLGYITDCKIMPDETIEKLRGVDTLVLNALRIEPHRTHMNLREALDVISMIAPRRTLLTHLSHDMGLQAEVGTTLPPGVEIAFDGLSIEI